MVQRSGQLSSKQEAWQHTVRHGVGEVAESSTTTSAKIRKMQTLRLTSTLETTKLIQMTYSNQQGHTYSNKNTVPSSAVP